LMAGTRATINRPARIGKIGRGPIVFRAAALAITEQQAAVRGTKQADQFLFDDDTARILNRSGIGRLRIRKCFVNGHRQRWWRSILFLACPMAYGYVWQTKKEFFSRQAKFHFNGEKLPGEVGSTIRGMAGANLQCFTGKSKPLTCRNCVFLVVAKTSISFECASAKPIVPF
jgi:hypothetical protein